MAKKISDSKPNCIGIYISEGKLSVLELEKGTIYAEDVSAALPEVYWEDTDILRTLLKEVLENIAINWGRSSALVCVPPDISEQGKRAFIEPVLQMKPKRIFIAEEFFVAALGAGVYQQNSETTLSKKIFLLVKNETSWLGLVFAGNALHVQVIPKGYDTLAIEDLRAALNQLLKNLTPQIPKQIKSMPVAKEELELIEDAWRKETEKQIYVTVSRRANRLWGKTLDDFQIIYTDERDEAVNKGLATFLSQLV